MNKSDLVVGIVAGVVAAVIWALITWEMRNRRLKRDFAHLAGRYRTRRKFELHSSGDDLFANITVKGNVLAVEFEGLRHPDQYIRGEIAMNEQLPKSGRGHYEQGGEQEILWGFWDVQVRDEDVILVHTTYATLGQTANFAGWVWARDRRVDPTPTPAEDTPAPAEE